MPRGLGKAALQYLLPVQRLFGPVLILGPQGAKNRIKSAASGLVNLETQWGTDHALCRRQPERLGGWRGIRVPLRGSASGRLHESPPPSPPSARMSERSSNREDGGPRVWQGLRG